MYLVPPSPSKRWVPRNATSIVERAIGISSLGCALVRGFAFQQAERSRAGELSRFESAGVFRLAGFKAGTCVECLVGEHQGPRPCHPVSPPVPASGKPDPDTGGDRLSGGSPGMAQASATRLMEASRASSSRSTPSSTPWRANTEANTPPRTNGIDQLQSRANK